MLMPIVLPERVVLPPGPTPAFLVPLRAAVLARTSVHDALVRVTGDLDFEYFTYATSSVPTPTRDSRLYVWTNMPDAWVRRYDEQAARVLRRRRRPRLALRRRGGRARRIAGAVGILVELRPRPRR